MDKIKIVAFASGNTKLFSSLVTLLVLICLFFTKLAYQNFFAGNKKRKIPSIKKSSSSDKKKTSSSRTSSTGSSSSKKHKSSHSSSSKKKVDSSLPSVILLVGVSGSGKSSWATQYLEKVHKSYIIISSDVIRSTVTGTITDFSKEEEVSNMLLAQIIQTLKLKRGCIVDDSIHNLNASFRKKLLAQLKENELEVNTVMHLFPIKSLFATTRIEKDIAEGKKRYLPTPVEMEKMQNLFLETEAAMEAEGWIKDK